MMNETQSYGGKLVTVIYILKSLQVKCIQYRIRSLNQGLWEIYMMGADVITQMYAIQR